MATNWTIPVVNDFKVFLAGVAVEAASKQQDEPAWYQKQVDILAATVERIRGAIRTAGRTRLSLTAGSIPPEARQHCFALTAQALLGSSLTIRITEDYGKLITSADDWLKGVEEGRAVTSPADPEDDPEIAGVPAVPSWGCSDTMDASTV